jgi:hypothetical protein
LFTVGASTLRMQVRAGARAQAVPSGAGRHSTRRFTTGQRPALLTKLRPTGAWKSEVHVTLPAQKVGLGTSLELVSHKAILQRPSQRPSRSQVGSPSVQCSGDLTIGRHRAAKEQGAGTATASSNSATGSMRTAIVPDTIRSRPGRASYLRDCRVVRARLLHDGASHLTSTS